MTITKPLLHTFAVALFVLTVSACTTTRSIISLENMQPASITAEELVEFTHDYSTTLNTITGSGRAIISEPGNNERVTLRFQSSRYTSLITVRNALGIEGGQILVDSDSLLIYNKIDNYAEKVSIFQSNLTSIGSLASLNMLDMFSYSIDADNINQIFEDDNRYVALLHDRSRVTISKDNGMVSMVTHEGTGSAYSQIEYEGYAEIDSFFLPRKITIFSNDGQSRATFLVQQLQINRTLENLTIELPENTPIRRL